MQRPQLDDCAETPATASLDPDSCTHVGSSVIPRSAMSQPSLSNSPWMRVAAHVGFSATPAENQVAHFPAQGSPPGGAASPRQPRPVQPKSNAMPAHHRFWGDQQERFLPPGPQLSEPEHVVDGAQSPGEGNQFGISRFRVTLVPVRSASTGLPHRVLIPRNSPLPPLGDPRVHSRSSVRAAAGSARTFFSRVCNFDDIITS